MLCKDREKTVRKESSGLKNKQYISFIVLVCMALTGCNRTEAPPPPAEQAVKAAIHEGYPLTFIQALEQQRQQLEAASMEIGAGLQSVVSISRSWTPGATITVAFKGGSTELRTRIIDATRPWTDAANIHLDFGDASQGYRQWSTSDSTYRGDIRIAFDGPPEGGYWSMVGRDSINTALRGSNMSSMNLEGFTEGLPWDWQAVVLHEFGHALGFEHEHQNPASTCEQEYRWNDDPGYTATRDSRNQFIRDHQGRYPGIYSVLGGPPNSWSGEQIDFNMRRFANTTDLLFSSFDRDSIMKYRFDSQLFRNLSVSTSSGCYSPATFVLSAQDRQAAARKYPHNPSAVHTVSAERSKLSKRMLVLKNLSAELREYFKSMTQTKKK
jgi:hypothetical protein